MKSILGLVGLMVWANVVVAQQDQAAAQDPIAKARAIYTSIVEARIKGAKEVEALRAKSRSLPDRAPEQAKISEELAAATKLMKSSMDPFFDAFRDLDWTKFDTKADKDLLETGLGGVSTQLTNAEKAAAAGRMFVQVFPTGRATEAILARRLPLALLTQDKGEEAVTVLRDAVGRTKEVFKAQSLTLLGDVLSVMGDFDGARKAYAELAATGQKVPAELGDLRAALVGQTAPPLDAKEWIGGPALDEAAMAGRVKVLVFWATHSPSARVAAQRLSAWHDEHVKDGLLCLAVTRPFGHGYLPADEKQIESGGRGRQGMKPEEFLTHLRDYHTNTRLHCPVAVSDEAVFAKYMVKPLPTFVVVRRDGKVALLTTNFDDLPVVEFASRRLLTEK